MLSLSGHGLGEGGPSGESKGRPMVRESSEVGWSSSG